MEHVKLHISSFSYKIVKRQYHSDVIKPRRGSELYDALQFSNITQNYIQKTEKDEKKVIYLELSQEDAEKVKQNASCITNYIDKYYKRLFAAIVLGAEDKTKAVYNFFDMYDIDETDYKIASAIKLIQRKTAKMETKQNSSVQKKFRISTKKRVDVAMLDNCIDVYFKNNASYLLTSKKKPRKKVVQNAKIWLYHTNGGYSLAELAKIFNLSLSQCFKNFKSFENEFKHKNLPSI